MGLEDKSLDELVAMAKWSELPALELKRRVEAAEAHAKVFATQAAERIRELEQLGVAGCKDDVRRDRQLRRLEAERAGLLEKLADSRLEVAQARNGRTRELNAKDERIAELEADITRMNQALDNQARDMYATEKLLKAAREQCAEKDRLIAELQAKLTTSEPDKASYRFMLDQALALTGSQQVANDSMNRALNELRRQLRRLESQRVWQAIQAVMAWVCDTPHPEMLVLAAEVERDALAARVKELEALLEDAKYHHTNENRDRRAAEERVKELEVKLREQTTDAEDNVDNLCERIRELEAELARLTTGRRLDPAMVEDTWAAIDAARRNTKPEPTTPDSDPLAPRTYGYNMDLAYCERIDGPMGKLARHVRDACAEGMRLRNILLKRDAYVGVLESTCRQLREELGGDLAAERAAHEQTCARVADLESKLRDCVTAMELWGAWEDGVPEAGDGEHGFVGNAYDIAKAVLGLGDATGERIGAAIRHADRLRKAEADHEQTRAELQRLRDGVRECADNMSNTWAAGKVRALLGEGG